MKVKPIHTEADHKAALVTIEKLWDAKAGTPDGDRLEILVVLVEAYERMHHAILPPDPIEAIKFRLEQRGGTRKDLEEILQASRGRVSEVLTGRRALTIAMMRALMTKLAIPAEVLLQSVEADTLSYKRGKKAGVSQRKTSRRHSSMQLAKK